MENPLPLDQATRHQKVAPLEWVFMTSVSILMLVLTGTQSWPISWAETFGFITGGMCVWLGVREHLWNWPIGLINNVFFFILFWNDRLFADAILQWFYFGLGAWGWWNWLNSKGGAPSMVITRSPRLELTILLCLGPIFTLGLNAILTRVQGSAPFWDSFTTVLSLAAQYLLCRKRLENWLFWIIADLTYVPLYFSRSMPLTAFLYFLFLLMCCFGYWKWQMRISPSRETGSGSLDSIHLAENPGS